jgi:hypothetical protein
MHVHNTVRLEELHTPRRWWGTERRHKRQTRGHAPLRATPRMRHERQLKRHAPRGDKFKQLDASFTQTIKSNKLGQRARKQFLHVFGWFSAVLADNPLGCILSFGLVPKRLHLAVVSLAQGIEEHVHVLVGAPAASGLNRSRILSLEKVSVRFI